MNTSTACGASFTPNTPSMNRFSRQGPSPQRGPGSQGPMGSCESLSPPSHNRTIDSQQYDSSHETYDDRDYDPAWIIPWHYRLCQCASDCPNYDPENEGIKHLSSSFLR